MTREPDPDGPPIPALYPPKGSPLANLLGAYPPGVCGCCDQCQVDPWRLVYDAVFLGRLTDRLAEEAEL